MKNTKTDKFVAIALLCFTLFFMSSGVYAALEPSENEPSAPSSELAGSTKILLQNMYRQLARQMLDTVITGPVELIFVPIESAGDRLPHWAEAAVGRGDTIFVPMSRDGKGRVRVNQQVLLHEFTHVLINRVTRPFAVPRWFHEGVAQWYTERPGFEARTAYGWAWVFGHLPELDDIDQVNSFISPKANLAYVQSYMAVRFIVTHWGEESIGMWLRNVRPYGGFWNVSERVFHVKKTEFEHLFEQDAQRVQNLILIISDPQLVWLSMPLLVLVSFFLFRLRLHRYKKNAEDPQDDASIDQSEKKAQDLDL